MNNLIDMSEYEKIIFVNGIDESQENIKLLAKNYPFVIFFTNNENAKESCGYPVANIWKGIQFNDELIATRLTRFIGIDEEHNSIEVNGRIFKLRFNYETGLIGLYEEIDNLFIYVGYEYPSNDILNNSNKISFTSADILNKKVLWDWQENIVSNIDSIDNFYIAIPTSYIYKIKPRWDAYNFINNDISKRVYVPCLEWFTEDNPTTLNGISFTVYKSKKTGSFKGKIQ